MKSKYVVKKDYHNTRFDRWFKQNVSDIPQSLNREINKKK